MMDRSVEHHDSSARFVPAPWTLRGDAWIVPQLHRAADAAPFVPVGCSVAAWRGWTLGGYVCVDYVESPVGPYREIMFVPALVRRERRWGFHVSHIYVDSAASVVGGRGNWWLPKDLLHFDLERHERTTLFRATRDAQPVATGVFMAARSGIVPFNNRWLPLRLLQAHADRLRWSAFWATGRIGVANGVLDLLNPALLPRLDHVVRLPSLHVAQFTLCFEKGKRIKQTFDRWNGRTCVELRD